METILTLTALLLTLCWYLMDTRKQAKADATRPVETYWGIVYLTKAINQPANEQRQAEPIERLYYSTPGQSYKGLIQKGRILQTGLSTKS